MRGLTRTHILLAEQCIVPCHLFLCLTNCTANFGKGARWPHSCLNVLLNRFPFTLLTKASWLVKIHLLLIVLKFLWDMEPCHWVIDMEPCHWVIDPSRQRNGFIFEGRNIIKKEKSVRKENLRRIPFLFIQTPEDKINTLSRKVGNQLPNNVASYPTRLETSATPLPTSKNSPRVSSLFLRPAFSMACDVP
jgi:hypothetical protein